jgi:hypothetical protein
LEKKLNKRKKKKEKRETKKENDKYMPSSPVLVVLLCQRVEEDALMKHLYTEVLSSKYRLKRGYLAPQPLAGRHMRDKLQSPGEYTGRQGRHYMLCVWFCPRVIPVMNAGQHLRSASMSMPRETEAPRNILILFDRYRPRQIIRRERHLEPDTS